MSKRRNPFETSESTPVAVHPPSIYDSLRVAAPRKRNRQWEKEHQSHKVVYRGVDPKLSLKVKSIAGDLLVPSGEVARAVIEYALRGYEQGDLDLHPRPNPLRMRMTLFPSSDSARSNDRPQNYRNKNTLKPYGGSSPPGAAFLPNSKRSLRLWHPKMD
ncbi:MAG: hypothetical protein IPN58_04430 [Anaerolineales bacterium]|nr:hypothetical protein [Anaerolineales bacterium]